MPRLPKVKSYPLLLLDVRGFLLVLLGQLLQLCRVVGLQPLEVALQAPRGDVHSALLLLVEVSPHLK